ncbi:MAG: aminopeptidase [Solirubrobacterales bacterium]
MHSPDSASTWVDVELAAAARRVLESYCEVKPGEEVLIVTDTRSDMAVCRALQGAALAAGAIPTMAVMPVTRWAGDDPPATIDGALERATLVLGVTHFSLGHSPTVKGRLADGSIRFVSMPGVDSSQMLTGANSADYDEVQRIGEALAKVVSAGSEIHVTTALGTDFTGDISGMPAKIDAAMAREMGQIGCFPGGEVFQAPRDGSVNGRIVVDRTIAMIGLLEAPVTYEVENGYVTEISGGADAERLRGLIDGIDNADHVGECAFGINPEAGITGNVSEDKKAWGTIHVALGDNLMYGGSTPSDIHLDGVISRPTVEIDGVAVVADGQILTS